MIDNLMWLVTLASIIGTVANVQQKRWCFYVWSATNGLWVAYDIYKTAYPQAALMAVYLGLAVWGVFAWKEKPNGDVRRKPDA